MTCVSSHFEEQSCVLLKICQKLQAQRSFLKQVPLCLYISFHRKFLKGVRGNLFSKRFPRKNDVLSVRMLGKGVNCVLIMLLILLLEGCMEGSERILAVADAGLEHLDVVVLAHAVQLTEVEHDVL